MAFFVLSVFLSDSRQFFTILAILLLVDSIWVGMSHLYGKNEPKTKSQNGNTPSDGFLIFARENPPYGWWAVMNIGFALLILLVVWSNLFSIDDHRVVACFLLVSVRTLLDYGIVWHFYYPPELATTDEVS